MTKAKRPTKQRAHVARTAMQLGREPTLLQSKLTPPRSGAHLVRRDELLARLDTHRAAKLTLLTAPAGYGKTVLLAQFAEHLGTRGLGHAWLGIDPDDNDVARFLRYVAGAVRTAVPEFYAPVFILPRPALKMVPETAIATLANAFGRLTGDLYLFIDDLHFLQDVPARHALNDLIMKSPPNLHVVASSRTLPDLPLGRLRAAGDLVELRWSDLEFSEAEVARLLTSNIGEMPTMDSSAETSKLVSRLTSETEGWPAGLQLALLSMNPGDRLDTLIARVSGENRNIRDFLIEDVLAKQPSEIQSFLLATSILDRLHPGLCAAVSGRADAQQLIDEIERRNLFIFSLDENRSWYRYHHLFSEFLRRELSAREPMAVPGLYRAAAEWCVEHEFFDDAVKYAFAGKDFPLAAQLLNAHCYQLWRSGHRSDLAKWIERLPASLRERFPRLPLVQAWSIMLEWRFEEAERILRETRSHAQAAGRRRKAGKTPSETRTILGELLFAELMLAFFTDNIVATETLCRKWLKADYTNDPFLIGSVECVFSSARMARLDCNYAIERAEHLENVFKRNDDSYPPVWFYSIFGAAYLFAGLIDDAYDYLTKAMDCARALTADKSSLVALPAVILAQALYERNDIEGARTLLADYLPLANSLGYVEQLIAGYVTKARILADDGDWAGAQAVLDAGDRYATTRRLRRLHVHLSAERARQLLARGEVDLARQCLQRGGLDREPHKFRPVPEATSEDAIRALVQIRALQAFGSPRESLTLGREWLRFLERRNLASLELRFGLLAARALSLLGENTTAHRELLRCLQKAAPHRLLRVFLDEPEPLRSAVVSVLRQVVHDGGPLEPFAAQLLDAYGEESAPDPDDDRPEREGVAFDTLSPRESDIIRLVSRGYSNRDIAQSLGITENTVKWNLRHVFDKLQVNRRLQAVNRAKSLGLIR